MPCLEAKGIEKVFGGLKAVSSLDFSVDKGAVYAVIGPNGAGKTTLFNMLSGAYRPTSGSILFNDVEVAGLEPHKIAAYGITRTFQNLQIFWNMTAIENVMVGCHLKGKCGIFSALFRLPFMLAEEKRLMAQAEEAIAFCNLNAWKHVKANAMPYGILKKLEIARALAAGPKLILLDEPAAGLNDTETAEITELIKQMSAQGITILLVEHHMGLVMSVANRVLVLNYGEKIAEGTPNEIQNNKKVIEAYLGQSDHEV